ncbi:copper resistance protein CopC/CopD [Paenibacillus glycanilyticus]|uniref:copper resistance CopC/CopD family protein n=1 Tax=Paenibacillus glycanilyticus TaxID=126569 RepID=UPI002041EBF6|nr:copper resistance protein CopC [Paenibacillus glycanilyticus]MCM3628027.1 copper resistance protein CopC/CopD [Paenibacillus glycanilyticus]
MTVNLHTLPKRILAAAILLVILVLALAPQAFAHATLEKTVPSANAKLDQSPPYVELNFNEAVEPGGGSLEVVDSQSNKIKTEDPVVENGGTTVKLPLPKLGDGVYSVSYHVISEDGHPVSGSYVFVVGNPPNWKDAEMFASEGNSSKGMQQNLLYVVRVLYYAALLMATGIALWSVFIRKRSESLQSAFKRLSVIGMRALLLTVLLHIFLQVNDLMKGQPLSAWGSLFTDTTTGRAWLELIVLVLLGFVAQRFNEKFVSLLWVVLLLGVESLIGHPAANDLKVLTIVFDFIHLFASAVWAGGLAVLLYVWYADRKEAGRFGASFSQGALISLVALVISGVLMTMLFLPKLSYLWLTTWGGLLTVKVVLVVAVLVTGTLLRLRMKKNGFPAGTLLKVDAILMACIVAIAAVFTYMSPLPANEPYNFHQMGEDMHVTFNVTPNVPGGDNDISLHVWLPEAAGAPKSVILRLRSDSREDAPIDIPLVQNNDKPNDSFPGYLSASYEATGPFLPYAAKWTAEIRVMDQDDNELVRETVFRNY